MEGGGRKKTRGMARTYVINFETNFKYVLVRKEKKPTQGSNKNLIVVIASRASEDALSASAIITLATTNIGVRISAGVSATRISAAGISSSENNHPSKFTIKLFNLHS